MPRLAAGDANHASRIPFRGEPGFPVRLPVDPGAIFRAFSEDPVPGTDPESPRLLRSPREEGGPGFHGVGVPDRTEAMIFLFLPLFDIIYITGR